MMYRPLLAMMASTILSGCSPIHQDVYINSNRDIGDRIEDDNQKRLSLERHDSFGIVVEGID